MAALPSGGAAIELAVLARDTFTRTAAGSWGKADIGGAYSHDRYLSPFAVAGGVGSLTLEKPNANGGAMLPERTARDADIRVRIGLDRLPSGGPAYLYAVARRTGTSEYRPKLIVNANGSVAVHVGVVQAGAESSLVAPRAVTGLVATAGSFVWLRASVTGANPTTIGVKAWRDGTVEPSAWQLTVTNGAAALQAAGSYGVRAYLARSVVNAPILATFDDLTLTPSPDRLPLPAPTFPPVAPPPGFVFAADDFEREASPGWGRAATGGIYSYRGRLADFNVGGGMARMSVPVGATRSSFLLSAVALDAEMVFTLALDRAPTGSGVYVYGTLRRAVTGAAYRPKIRILADGSVQAHVGVATVTGEMPLGSPVVVPDLKYTAGEPLRVRSRAAGTNPTRIDVRVWKAGDVEPAVWHVSGTDSTPDLQREGAVGLLAYVSSDATAGPYTLSMLDFVAATTDLDPQPLDGRRVLAAGDIATCAESGDEATARLLGLLDGDIFTLGDNAYPDGSEQQYALCYGNSWGRYKSRTHAAVGNHEYRQPGAAPHYAYFGAAAGPAGLGYYALDIGAWRVYVLNSNCEAVACDAGSVQEQWLRSDLAAYPRECSLAIWHHPRFSSGAHGSLLAVAPLWKALDDAGVDVALTGHDHHYERFAPLDGSGAVDTASGIRQFVVGTGGAPLRVPRGLPIAGSEMLQATALGVLQLTLGAGQYEWEFIPIAGQTVTDRGSASCH